MSVLLATSRRRLSTAADALTLPLTHPSVVVWGSNTGVGKTLISTGLAAASVASTSSSSSRFTYIKPVQTGFPLDSDSRFLYRKVTQLFQRRKPPRTVLFASNRVMKASAKVCEGLGFSEGLRELGVHEERRLVGVAEEEEGKSGIFKVKSELVCETICAWSAAISPHLAVEREGGAVGDSALLEMVGKCLRRGLRLEEGGKDGVMCVVETAGGVASPGPSGSLQCDLYR